MGDYSKEEFLYHIAETDRKKDAELIDRETYKAQIRYFVKRYGANTKLAKKILSERNA